MDEETLDKIGQLAEQLDSSLFALQTMSMLGPRTHLKGLSETMFEVRNSLAEIYKTNGGEEEELDLQAKR